VPVNVYTTLVAGTPKLMLNVESDDFGELVARRCGCHLDGLGLRRHLHTMRSHEKLTSEGMNFLGSDLLRLIEEILPARFGGGPTDFQLVEDEDASGLPQVQLFVSRRLGPLPDAAVVDTVAGFLNDTPGASAPTASAGGKEAPSAWCGASLTQPRQASMALHTRKPKTERPSPDRAERLRA